MRGQAWLASAVAAAALATAQPAAAQYSSYHDAHVAQQQQCERVQQNRTITGAVLGGLAGAVLGSQAAARGHRTDGSVLGGVLGAAAGAAIGRSSANNAACRTAPVQGAYDPYYGQPYGQTQPYERGYSDRDLEGGPYDESAYGYGDGYGDRNRRGQECRWGEQVMRDPDGYEYREQVQMCRGRDGVWRPA